MIGYDNPYLVLPHYFGDFGQVGYNDGCFRPHIVENLVGKTVPVVYVRIFVQRETNVRPIGIVEQFCKGLPVHEMDFFLKIFFQDHLFQPGNGISAAHDKKDGIVDILHRFHQLFGAAVHIDARTLEQKHFLVFGHGETGTCFGDERLVSDGNVSDHVHRICPKGIFFIVNICNRLVYSNYILQFRETEAFNGSPCFLYKRTACDFRYPAEIFVAVVNNPFPFQATHEKAGQQGVQIVGNDDVTFSEKEIEKESDIEFGVEDGFFSKKKSHPVGSVSPFGKGGGISIFASDQKYIESHGSQ